MSKKLISIVFDISNENCLFFKIEKNREFIPRSVFIKEILRKHLASNITDDRKSMIIDFKPGNELLLLDWIDEERGVISRDMFIKNILRDYKMHNNVDT